MNKFNKFASIMSSKKFHDDLKSARVLVSNLHTFNEMREDFAWFIVAYPVSESKKMVLSKLDGKKKFGVLSRHLMGVCKRLGIPDLYLSKYHELKDDEKGYTKNLKEESWRFYWNGTKKSLDTQESIISVSRDEAKLNAKREILSNQLKSQTMDMLEFCLSKYNAREDKINQILEEN